MTADLPQRKPLRLKGYDYSAEGVYFLTVCAKDKKPLFSTVSVGGGVFDAPQVTLTDAGNVIEKQITDINNHYTHLRIDKHVIMPNHVHLLVLLKGTPVGPSGTPAPMDRAHGRVNEVIPAFVSALKRLADRACGDSLWQRGYHDHVVRDEADYLRLWTYIDDSPAHWLEDFYYTNEP